MDVSSAGCNHSEGCHLENKEITGVNVTSHVQVDSIETSASHVHTSGNMTAMLCEASTVEHSDNKACQSDIRVGSDSSNVDREATIVDSTFVEECLQTRKSVLSNTCTDTVVCQETEILKIKHPEFEGSSRRRVWFSCSVCRFYFPNTKTIEEHNKMYHNHELPYICRVCAMRFRSMYSLKYHCTEMHKNASAVYSRPWVCLICKQRYTKSEFFKKHLLCHLEDIKMLYCSICYKTEQNHTKMEKHMSSHLKSKDTNLFSGLCQVCGYKTNRRDLLKRHQEIHVDTKNFYCSECNSPFRSKFYLARHMRIHTEENLVPCEICGKCVTKAGIAQHMRMHTNERPYRCDICDAAFRQMVTLQNHMKTHTKERPYSCSVCSKNFTQQQAVTRHMRTHTGEKPYQCLVCHKRFTQSSGLNGHMRRHSEGKFGTGALVSSSVSTYNRP